MTQIALTDSALVRLLESCDFPGVTIQSAPHEWDAGYVQRLLTATPAVLVAFLGAEPYDAEKSTVLDMVGKWAAYVVVGWNGKSEKERRIGAGAGFDLMHRAAAAIHGAVLTEPNGERLPQSTVEGLQVLTDSALDLANLWIGEIAVSVDLPLELQESDACYGPLDDYLKTAATIDIPGGHTFDPDTDRIGVDGDVTIEIDMPQT